MTHTGEIIALLSAASCTVTALYASEASSRLGTMTVNVLRLFLAVVFLVASMWIATGYPYPVYADGRTWLFLALSAIVGYVIGVSLSLAAVNQTNTGIASTLMALTPVLIIIPYSVIYRQKVTLKEIVGVTVSMAGVAMFFML